MRYIANHDYHIHSKLSLCSNDPLQNNDRILAYAEENGFDTICLTDHFWDESVPCSLTDFYKQQDYAHISAALPLPQSHKTRFLFGCETELDKQMLLGLSPEHFDRFDFVIVPTTHLHMRGFTIDDRDAASPERRAALWVSRLDGLLAMDLPFTKIGIAHLTCPLLAPDSWQEHIDVLNMISDDVLIQLFDKARSKGAGIELNFPLFKYSENDLRSVLRIYRIAKQCGCKFYFGSDAHHPAALQSKPQFFEKAIDLLNLEESDKFQLKQI